MEMLVLEVFYRTTRQSIALPEVLSWMDGEEV